MALLFCPPTVHHNTASRRTTWHGCNNLRVAPRGRRCGSSIELQGASSLRDAKIGTHHRHQGSHRTEGGRQGRYERCGGHCERQAVAGNTADGHKHRSCRGAARSRCHDLTARPTRRRRRRPIELYRARSLCGTEVHPFNRDRSTDGSGSRGNAVDNRCGDRSNLKRNSVTRKTSNCHHDRTGRRAGRDTHRNGRRIPA